MERIDIGVEATEGIDVSPDLWGLFFEDLNYALDGGLNAELVVNGDFEFTEADSAGWGPLAAWGVESRSELRTVWPRTTEPLDSRNAVHLRIEGPTTLRNDGWDGVGVGDASVFRLRFAARAVEGASSLNARIADGPTELTSWTSTMIHPGPWAWYEVDIVGRLEGRGRLELSVPDGTVLDLDCVSLRPLDEQGSPVLFRPDLMAALEALRPSFLRFPGGCLAHGVGLDNIYDWKGSIGPLHERRQMPNPWGYHQSRAIGYFEYFLLCERLGATPVPVVAAGVCCQNTPGGPRAVTLDEMPAYTQDVLDLIEFTTGGADTPWGGRRAELGHPEPFALRYLGVGNEDEITPDFRERYAMIERAVQDAHPGIRVIGTTGPSWFGRDHDLGWQFARDRGIDIVDEHYYEAPYWFHQNLDRYDDVDRRGPSVYLGEYAARSSRVRSALAEAAYMIGLERNSDLVALASYAPLLARIGHSQWQPDLIYFDAERILPTASYYVQQMFSAERGTRVHAVRAELGGVVPFVPLAQGEVTFRSDDSTFEVRELVINRDPRPLGHLAAGTRLSAGELSLTDLDMTFEAERRNGNRGLAIDLGGDGAHPAFTIEISLWRNEHTTIKRRQFGIAGDVAEGKTWPGFTTGVPVEVRIIVSGSRVRVWLGKVLVHDIQPSTAPEQRIAVGALSRPAADGGIEHVLRLVNATDDTLPVSVNLDGRLVSSARTTVLAGAGPDDGAVFEESPVHPVEQTHGASRGGVDLDLEPWSFTVAVVSSSSTERPPISRREQ